MKGNSLTQAKRHPKMKNKLIKEIFILTTRVGRGHSSKPAM